MMRRIITVFAASILLSAFLFGTMPLLQTETMAAGTNTAGAKNRIQNVQGALKAKGKTVTIKTTLGTLKKAKKISAKKAYKITGRKGKLTFKKVKANRASKKFKVNSKTGQITIKKGLKKGTYKLTVKIKDSRKNKRKPVSVKAVVTIKVVGTASTQDLSYVPPDMYLKASTNCQAGNAKIKSYVNSVSQGLTDTKAKATALFNYVRDQISYVEYFDTKYGAVGTLNQKSGNDADQAHLLIALLRTASIPARYKCGTCSFGDGSVKNHVWVECFVDDKWVSLDPTSPRNSFGSITNWNVSSVKNVTEYASLPF